MSVHLLTICVTMLGSKEERDRFMLLYEAHKNDSIYMYFSYGSAFNQLSLSPFHFSPRKQKANQIILALQSQAVPFPLNMVYSGGRVLPRVKGCRAFCF